MLSSFLPNIHKFRILKWMVFFFSLFLLQEQHIPVYSMATWWPNTLWLRFREGNAGWLWRIPSEKYFQLSAMFYWRISRNPTSLWRFGCFFSKDTDGGTGEGKYFQWVAAFFLPLVYICGLRNELLHISFQACQYIEIIIDVSPQIKLSQIHERNHWDIIIKVECLVRWNKNLKGFGCVVWVIQPTS